MLLQIDLKSVIRGGSHRSPGVKSTKLGIDERIGSADRGVGIPGVRIEETPTLIEPLYRGCFVVCEAGKEIVRRLQLVRRGTQSAEVRYRVGRSRLANLTRGKILQHVVPILRRRTDHR